MSLNLFLRKETPVTVQEVVKACLTSKSSFGRPLSWKGTGTAIDLGRRMDGNKARCLAALHSPGNFLGSDWEVNPTDLLADWEVVDAEKLFEEASQPGRVS